MLARPMTLARDADGEQIERAAAAKALRSMARWAKRQITHGAHDQLHYMAAKALLRVADECLRRAKKLEGQR